MCIFLSSWSPARHASVPVLLTAVCLMGIVASCSGTDGLTPDQREKIDPALRRAIGEGEPPGLARDEVPTEHRDGVTIYLVFISTSDVDALRREEIPVGSVAGDVVTARLTAEEIRRTARLEAVRQIVPSGHDSLHHGEGT